MLHKAFEGEGIVSERRTESPNVVEAHEKVMVLGQKGFNIIKNVLEIFAADEELSVLLQIVYSQQVDYLVRFTNLFPPRLYILV